MHSRTKFRVRYAETDQMGIVHHSNFAVWYEMGRTDYIKMMGANYADMEKNGIMTPLLNLNCTFLRPAYYDDEIILRTKVIMISPAKLTFTYTIKRIENDGSETELGHGSTEHGFVDAKTFRPCNIKKRMPELFEKINATLS